MTKELIEYKNISAIITKKNGEFKVMTEEKLNQIVEFMPEMDRAATVFGKQNSQTTSSLMTLSMLESGPYRVLRQILAQIERKRSALKENMYKREKSKLERERFLKELDEITTADLPDGIKERGIKLEIIKIEYDLVDATNYIEGALKELGAYMERYKEVCKNNNIPEQWDEEDFESSEVEHHIKTMFRSAIRDRMQGAPNMGTMEYMEQFGINPIVGYRLVDDYIANIRNSIGKDTAPDIGAHYTFFDNMYKLFKDEYKKAAARIGLDSITQADFLMKENK